MNRFLQRKCFLALILFFLAINSYSQSNFNVIVEGLVQGDSARVVMQKSSEILIKKWVIADSLDSTLELDFDLDNGAWALKVEATGYSFPSSRLINIPEDSTAEITFTKLLEENYKYTWHDDESSSGHATQTYVGEPTSIIIKDSNVNVPNDYSSIKLRNEFGIVLSNNIEPWSMEDSYRLYSMLRSLPYDPNYNINFETGEGIRGIFYLTNDEQYKDLTITHDAEFKNATISQSAFTYASPLVATVDGIKGKFYSKRLYHVVVNYFTDLGTNADAVDHIANESFGFKFMKSDQATEDLMGEHASNFQEFFAEEKVEILAMFEELPEGFHKQDELKYMVRRVNGQDNPTYPSAAAIAWVGNETIEWMSKAFNQTDLPNVHRLILHEKAHFMWEYLFDQTTKEDWIEIGGWFEDPTSESGWSTYNTTEFVSAYAHSINPDEDMAESIATYVTNPDLLLSRSVRKYEFIRDRIMHGTRYIAQIREDLTFTVYNLFPDYNYPGKIIGVDVEVTGEPEEDKTVKIKLHLNVEDVQLDGASGGQLRLVSSKGTIKDILFTAKNGSVDSVLVGQTHLSKHAKNGYWVLGSSIIIEDNVGNTRYENHSTIGLKLYINNPLEDTLPPVWNNEFSMNVIEEFFDSMAEGEPVGSDHPDAVFMKAIKFDFTLYDDSPMNRSVVRTFFPKVDSTDAQLYENQIDSAPIDSTNQYNNYKRFILYQKIPDYFPSGYYAIPMISAEDVARNKSSVYFMNDISDFITNPEKGHFAHIRDSVYVQNEYPDYIKPEIDVNNITIIAEPVNPISPDGETNVDLTFLYRDLSDYEGHESGVKDISFILRDPLGRDHRFRAQDNSASAVNSNWTGIWYDLTPENSNEWNSETFKVRLPKGSAPGKWGLASLDIIDKAGNMRKYSFVEYIRFDVIESDVELTQELEVEILDKHINAGNVESISAKMTCSPCEGLNYVYTIYSRMGGGSVVRGEGSFENDTIVVNNINTSGVLDGLVNLTVQVTDSTSRLVATKSAEYLKDVVYPKSYYALSNIQDQGWSNLDDFIVEIEVESQDIDGEFNLKLLNYLQNESEDDSSSTSDEYGVNLEGSISNESVVVIDESNNNELESLLDGYLQLSLEVTDFVGNKGTPEITYYQKSNNKIRYIGETLTSSSCEVVENVVVTLVEESAATISWTSSATATSGYKINVYESGTNDLVATEEVSSINTSVQINGLSESTDYDVLIESNCGADITTVTEIVGFTTLTPLTITCASNTTIDTVLGSCDYTVVGSEFDATFIGTGTLTNDLNGSTTLAGETLPLGETTVVWTVANDEGQSESCTTIITVEDNEAPEITCVSDTIFYTDVDSSTYTVFDSELDAIFTDNCSSASITNDFNGLATLANEELPLGTTSIVWSVDDGHGQIATCTLEVVVKTPLAITCALDSTLDTDLGMCNYTVVGSELDAMFTGEGILTNDLNGSTTLAGETLPLGETTVVWTVVNDEGQSESCTTIITVEDNEAPEITCVSDTIFYTDVDSSTYTVFDSELDAIFTDNCSSASITNDFNGLATLANEELPLGTTSIVWSVDDGHGQIATCTLEVVVKTPLTITCALDSTLDTDLGMCNYTVVGSELDAMFTGEGILTNDLNGSTTLAGETLPLGETTVVWTVVNDEGQSESCTTIITVEDNEAPEITCPSDLTVDTEPDVPYYVVPNYFDDGQVTAVDNCTASIVVVTQEPAPATQLLEGTHLITFTAKDTSGNTSTCSFELTVNAVLGLNDYTMSIKDIKLYPNPANHNIVIANPSGLSLDELSVYDLQGRFIKSYRLKDMGAQKQLDISELETATYFVVIKGEGSQVIKKLIKK